MVRYRSLKIPALALGLLLSSRAEAAQPSVCDPFLLHGAFSSHPIDYTVFYFRISEDTRKTLNEKLIAVQGRCATVSQEVMTTYNQYVANYAHIKEYCDYSKSGLDQLIVSGTNLIIKNALFESAKNCRALIKNNCELEANIYLHYASKIKTVCSD